MGAIINGAWCILRTSGAKTLPLADSLDLSGLCVWTPRKMQVRRRPGGKLTVERESPITPTFVFAAAGELMELSSILAKPVSPHPPFSIFRHAGRVPLIADGEIDGLRREEDREKIYVSRSRRRGLVIGQRVRFDTGAIAGMEGVIRDQMGDYALISFAGGVTLKIASWLLPENDINHRQPETGTAA